MKTIFDMQGNFIWVHFQNFEFENSVEERTKQNVAFQGNENKEWRKEKGKKKFAFGRNENGDWTRKKERKIHLEKMNTEVEKRKI